MNVITRGVRNAFRNVIRTFSIATILGLSIGLCLVMLIAHQAVTSKIEAVKASIGNTVTMRPAGYGGPGQTTGTLATAQLNKVGKLAHITALTKSLEGVLTTSGATVMKGSGVTSLQSPIQFAHSGANTGATTGASTPPADFSPPISILGTTEPAGAITSVGATVTVTSGTAIDGSKDTDKAMISEAMATKNNLKLGGTFTAYDKTLTIAAIFKSNTATGDDFVIVSLPTMQRLSSNANAITGATATVDSVDNIDSTLAAVKKALGSDADATSSKASVEQAIKPLKSIQQVSLYSLGGAVVAGAVITLLAMVMIVRERRREIGVIKAIGFSNGRIMAQFVAEAVTLTLLGAVVGLVLGVAAGGSITHTLVDNSSSSTMRPGGPGGGSGAVAIGGPALENILNVQAQIGWPVLLEGLGVALVIAMVGSGLASLLIARVRPAEVLRSE